MSSSTSTENGPYKSSIQYQEMFISPAEMNGHYAHLRKVYETNPSVLALLERHDVWTRYIAYIGTRSKSSEYLRQIERATNADVINRVNPDVILGGCDEFTTHVSNLIDVAL
jgi:hypothetical protein